MKVGVEVQGLKEFNKALRLIGEDMPKGMTEIHKKLAEPVAKRAASRAPKKSGSLAQTVRAVASQKSAAVAAGKKRVPYAAVIHWGWPKRDIKPQPFMSETIQSMEGDLVDEYQKLLGDFINEALKKGSA